MVVLRLVVRVATLGLASTLKGVPWKFFVLCPYLEDP